MKDYRKLTDEELFNELNNLHAGLGQEEEMDENGFIVERIYKMYEPFFDAVIAEMDNRGLYEHESI